MTEPSNPGGLGAACSEFWASLGGQNRAGIPEVLPLQAAASDTAALAARDVEDLTCPCDDKWLVVTITRHTKHIFGGRWDCTVGTLEMELWDTEEAGSGKLVFTCATSERGGPATPDFVGESNGPGYQYQNQYIIVGRDTYGLSPHSTTNYKTYGYQTAFPAKPRPGIAIYGTGSGAMDRRGGVLIHAGTSHTWSVGCIVIHRDGAVDGNRYRFDGTVSYNTLLEFFEKIHDFKQVNTLPIGRRIDRVKLRIRESF
jgi:hypothetical protein